MCSEQQNLGELGVGHSLEHQGVSGAVQNDPTPDAFSIREYALAARHKDLSCSWPFSERHLEVFLKHGISNVLPPLAPWDLAANRSRRGLENQENDVGNERNLVERDRQGKVNQIGHDLCANKAKPEESTRISHPSLSGDCCKIEESHQLSNNTIADSTVTNKIPCLHPTANKMLRRKRRKGKMKARKRSMADILARAKHCKLKELHMVGSLDCNVIKSQLNEGEENSQIASKFETKESNPKNVASIR